MTTVLLDTHVLLWWLFNDGRLSYQVRDLIRLRQNNILVSAASAWEISTKHRIGKLPEAGAIVSDLPTLLRRARIESIAVTVDDALLAGGMLHEHRDPFDRMIAAQSELRDIVVATNDPVIGALGASTVW